MDQTIYSLVTGYEQIGREIGRLVESKQAQYGNSFDVAPAILSHLYPEGVAIGQYADLLAVVRVLDKLKRVATRHPSDQESPWQDIAGYAILMLAREREGHND